MASKNFSGVLRIAFIALAAVILAKLVTRMVPGLSGFGALL